MGSKKQRLNNVYGSKVAARQDLMQMLLPTLGVAFLFLAPAFLISVALRIVCFDPSSMEDRAALTYGQLAEALGGVWRGASCLSSMPRIRHDAVLCMAARGRAGAGVRDFAVLYVHTAVRAVDLDGADSAAVRGFVADSMRGNLSGGRGAVSVCPAHNDGLFDFYGACHCCEHLVCGDAAAVQCGYSLMAERQNMSCWRAVRTAAKSCRGHPGSSFFI